MVKNYIIAELIGVISCLTGLIDLPIWAMLICVASMMTGLYMLRSCKWEYKEPDPPKPQEETFRAWLEQGTIGR